LDTTTGVAPHLPWAHGARRFEEAAFMDRESRTMHNLALTAGPRFSF